MHGYLRGAVCLSLEAISGRLIRFRSRQGLRAALISHDSSWDAASLMESKAADYTALALFWPKCMRQQSFEFQLHVKRVSCLKVTRRIRRSYGMSDGLRLQPHGDASNDHRSLLPLPTVVAWIMVSISFPIHPRAKVAQLDLKRRPRSPMQKACAARPACDGLKLSIH